MRRAVRIAGWVLLLLGGIPLLLVAVVLVGLNTGPGRHLAETLVARVTGGSVALSGLSGRFPDALRLAHVEVRDARGAWLIGDDVRLDWAPIRLLGRDASVRLLEVGHLQVPRLPVPSSSGSSESRGGSSGLPVRVDLDRLRVDRLDLGAPVAGAPASLSVDGSAHLASLDRGDADVTVRRLDGDGLYHVAGRLDPAGISARIAADEPAGGLIARLGGLPDLGAITLRATLDGPRNAEATELSLAAGPLRATAKGTLDLQGMAADLDVAASAPAMTPRPDVSWQSVRLDARVRGPFARPDASGHLRAEGLEAAGAAVRTLSADVEGNAGRVNLRATAEGVRVPGPDPALLEAAPLRLTADARLDQPSRPVAFTVDHPLLRADGTADTAGTVKVATRLVLPDLAPLAALGGTELRGHADLQVRAALAAATMVDVDGTVGITGGKAPVPALLGEDARVGVSAALQGSDVTLSRLTLDGKTLRVSADGTDRGGALDARWRVALSDLSAVAPQVEGGIEATGTAKGRTDDLAVTADARGEVAGAGVPRGPVHVVLDASGLPGKPSGTLRAEGALDGAPLALSVAARRDPDGALHATIDRADWKSTHAAAALTLPAGATLPLGHADLRIGSLEDFRRLSGLALSGSVTASVNSGDELRATLDARDAGVPGGRVGRATLEARVADPLGQPSVAAHLAAENIAAGSVKGSATLDANGPQGALALKLSAALRDLAGADASAKGAAVLDVPGRTVSVSALDANWHNEALRLLAPVRVGFGDGVVLDRLRLGLGAAVLEAAGRVSPTLDLTASARNLSADLAKPFAPDLAVDGSASLDARLSGTPARPAGTVRLAASGVRMRSGPGRGLPPAALNATATLAGTQARLDARLAAGANALTVAGTAPLDAAGALDLRANGSFDLAVLDPVLTAAGRRARGRLVLAATAAGPLRAPRLGGTATLSNGEVQDFEQGLRITDLAANVALAGDTVRITRLSGRAGPGTISATGSVGVLAPGMPIDLSLTARNARPLASDRLTAELDADLTLRGALAGSLAAAGSIRVNRAEIRVPDRLPATVAVLDVRRPGERPPPPPAPGPTVALDLRIDAPRAIFVTGRGLDAELGGTLRIGGSSMAPQVGGGFELRRGTFSLVGTTLNFTRGKVGFDGTGVTGRIDPTLDFEADSQTSTVLAKLLVTGYASAPKITLSSVPELPQDEVLAQLLFGRSTKDLGPFQIASIAAGLAELSGVGGGAGGNPLDTVRRGLGLDRLSLGSGPATPGGAPSSPGSKQDTGPRVEAGRYVANGVYVGARQGAGTSESQATVQIDITRGLKLETDVGTGRGGNAVGLTYQFEY